MLFNLAELLSSVAFVCILASVLPTFYINAPTIPPTGITNQQIWKRLHEAGHQPACPSIKLPSKSWQLGFEAAPDLFIIVATEGWVFKVYSRQKIKSDLTETWLVITRWKTWQKELGSSYIRQTTLSGRHATVTIQSSVKLETRQIKSVTYHESDTGIESYFEKPTLHHFQHMLTALTSFIHGKEITPHSRRIELCFILRTLSFLFWLMICYIIASLKFKNGKFWNSLNHVIDHLLAGGISGNFSDLSLATAC